MVEKLPRRAARSRCAASRSGIEAAVTTTASSRPFTSTARCRLTPFVLLAPSQPRPDRGTVSAAGTVCESMIAAVGQRSRPARPAPASVAQRVEDALPRPAAGPAGEHRLHRRGWRELHWQLPPRDTTAHYMQDGVHYRTAAMLLGSSAAGCRAARRR